MFILFFLFFLCHSDSQTNNLGSSRHLRSFFFLDGGLPPSSFVLSLYRIISMFSAPFPFSESGYKGTAFISNRQIFRELFFKFLFQNPASAPVRRPPASRQSFTTTGLFRFCGCKGTAFYLSRQTFQHLFCPSFQLFSQSPIYQRVIRTKKSLVIHQECQRFLLFPEFSPHYASRAPFGPS